MKREPSRRRRSVEVHQLSRFKQSRNAARGRSGLPQARISQQTFYRSKAKFGRMDVSEARKLTTFETENGRLKKLLADAMLRQRRPEVSFGKELTTLLARRSAALRAMAKALHLAMTCLPAGSYRSQDGAARARTGLPKIGKRMLEIAREWRRFGYCRIVLMLARERLELLHTLHRIRPQPAKFRGQ